VFMSPPLLDAGGAGPDRPGRRSRRPPGHRRGDLDGARGAFRRGADSSKRSRWKATTTRSAFSAWAWSCRWRATPHAFRQYHQPTRVSNVIILPHRYDNFTSPVFCP
jgi:hypothetical protein